MREYGIDGAILQRFVSELSNPASKNMRNEVTRKVKRYAEAHDRKFYVMYDITSSNPDTLIRDIKSDWSEIENNIGVQSSPSYARQDGRPVIGLWGFGFTDRPGTQEQAQEIINWFKNKGYYVVGGVPYSWRTENGASRPGWLSTYVQYDMISPWSVGNYSSLNEIEKHTSSYVIPDKRYCDEHGIHYQRVIYPGFAWSNWNGGSRNLIPRLSGNFMWQQAYQLTGVTKGAFVAMFDEYDEGTAIAKAAENASMIPNNQYYLTLDADGQSLSSDFYLRLTGAATLMLKGVTPKTSSIPIPQR